MPRMAEDEEMFGVSGWLRDDIMLGPLSCFAAYL